MVVDICVYVHNHDANNFNFHTGWGIMRTGYLVDTLGADPHLPRYPSSIRRDLVVEHHWFRYCHPCYFSAFFKIKLSVLFPVWIACSEGYWYFSILCSQGLDTLSLLLEFDSFFFFFSDLGLSIPTLCDPVGNSRLSRFEESDKFV